MNQNIDIQKPRLGWNVARSEMRSSTPSKQGQSRSNSPAVSIGRTSISTPDTSAVSKSGPRVSPTKMLRKDSVRLFSDAAMAGQVQKKMALQGKLLQMKAQARKDSFLKEGGIKKVMAAPSVMMAFRKHISIYNHFRFRFDRLL